MIQSRLDTIGPVGSSHLSEFKWIHNKMAALNLHLRFLSLSPSLSHNDPCNLLNFALHRKPHFDQWIT